MLNVLGKYKAIQVCLNAVSLVSPSWNVRALWEVEGHGPADSIARHVRSPSSFDAGEFYVRGMAVHGMVNAKATSGG